MDLQMASRAEDTSAQEGVEAVKDVGYIDGRQGEPPPARIRVTVTDLATGESESVEIEDDYVLTVAGSAYLAHTNAFANGTHVLTVKGRREVKETLKEGL
jgi:hypothetical protein